MEASALEVFYPYCVQRLAEDRYVILNRHYKPLGMFTKASEDWSPYAVRLRMTPQIAARLSWQADANMQSIQLYRDAAAIASAQGWAKYQARINYLSQKVMRVEAIPAIAFTA